MIGGSDDVRLDETPPAIDPVSCLPALLRLAVRLTSQIQCFYRHEVVLNQSVDTVLTTATYEVELICHLPHKDVFSQADDPHSC